MAGAASRNSIVAWMTVLSSDSARSAPAHPSIAELREVTQPASVRTRAGAEHWVAHAYLRDISPYLTRLLLGPGFSANGVTWLMITSAALAAVATGLAQPGGRGRGRGLGPAADAAGLLRRRGGPVAADVVAARGLPGPDRALRRRVRDRRRPGRTRSRRPAAVAGVWISAGLLLGLLVALNKVENDLVHVARHYAGLSQVRDAEEVRVPTGGALRSARRMARFVPFHRVFHSVEMSLLILAAALVDLVARRAGNPGAAGRAGGGRGRHRGRPPGGRTGFVAASMNDPQRPPSAWWC